jgi:uncharacterized surface protein with fasciclin (FAS1) repeats
VFAPTLILAVCASLLQGGPSTASTGSCSSKTTATDKTIVQTAVTAGSFQTLATALQAADLVDALSGPGPFTVFAPTDEAFAKLPKETLASLLEPKNKPLLQSILKYHVVAGDVRAQAVTQMQNAGALNGQRIPITIDEGAVRAAGAKVLKTDVACSNGVIHVIDSVMMPATSNVVDTAVAAGSFKTLAKALQAAGLVEVLSGPGPFTVLAPTDDAFAKLPAGTLERLLRPENKSELATILKCHVLSGRVYSDQLAAGEVATLAGQKFPIKFVEGAPRIGNAGVAKADLETTNGVIHVIDTVLLPAH